jgi:outer membrane protein OmpA-like peptidoglycan-associated protein
MPKSYYQIIDGKNYDRNMLRIASRAKPASKNGKPIIGTDLAKKIFHALSDGAEYTDVEKATMKYIRDNYLFTPEADEYLRTEVRKFSAKNSNRKKGKRTQANNKDQDQEKRSRDSKIREKMRSTSRNQSVQKRIHEGGLGDSDAGSADLSDSSAAPYTPIAYPIEDKPWGIEKPNRRKQRMIRGGLILLFLAMLLGVTWTVCKPKWISEVRPSDSGTDERFSMESESDFSDREMAEEDSNKKKNSMSENSTNGEEVTPNQMDPGNSLGSVGVETGPGKEGFQTEPGIAGPIVRIPFQLDSEKSSIRFVNSLQVTFVRNQEDLTIETQSALSDLASVLKAHPKFVVRINGHTCWIGDLEDNQNLSEQRAKIVYDFLIGKGVSSGQIEYRGYGELAPVATNRTKEGRLRNRRVDFTVLRLSE